MAFVPPDPNVFYPIPPGQLPPGFVPPPPGAAVRGIPIVVPVGLEMLISPEGFPVFVPERSSAPPPPYPSSPTTTTSSSPALSHQMQPSTTPKMPSRHSTISSHGTFNQFSPTTATSPALSQQQQQHQQQQQQPSTTPKLPSRHSTISSHSPYNQFSHPPVPVPTVPQTPISVQSMPLSPPVPLPDLHYHRPVQSAAISLPMNSQPISMHLPPQHQLQHQHQQFQHLQQHQQHQQQQHQQQQHQQQQHHHQQQQHQQQQHQQHQHQQHQHQHQQQQQPTGLTFASITSSFRTSSESVSAWTFYSLGLNQNPGQKEIVITLRQRPSNYSLEDVQPIMYNLYLQMNGFIQSNGGKPLTAGDTFSCRVDTPDVGPVECNILLIHAPPECKGTLENKDVLYGIMATPDERAVFAKYGAARTLTNMGNDLETWPVPLWSDWSRPSLLQLDDFRGSLTEMVPVLQTKNIVATLDTITHRLTLVISSTALDLIQADMKRFPPAQEGVITSQARVTFLLDLDAGAQAYLTWRTGQEGPAIFNARPNPTGFHGCWMSFNGINPHEEATVQESIAPREDGIELKMKGSTWERLYQALMSRTAAVVPVGTETVHLSYP